MDLGNQYGANDTDIDLTSHYSVRWGRCYDQYGARSGSPQLYGNITIIIEDTQCLLQVTGTKISSYG